MFKNNTDEEWELYGKDDPYYGVYTDPKFQRSSLDEDKKQDFFDSGYAYIEKVFKNIHKHVDDNFSPTNALDFGCGVGRLVIPLSERVDQVTGIDVSDSMLAEAKCNCTDRSISNVSLLKSDDTLSALDGKYSFIHSFIVFQHIPAKRGEKILRHLISHLDDNGVCVIHFTYAKTEERKKLVPFLKAHIPFAKNCFNLRHGRPFNYPYMQMNNYNLNAIFSRIQKLGASGIYTEYTNHRGALGVTLYFKRPGPEE